MVSEINTVTFNGINTVDVNVQVSLSPGLPAFNIVGLPDKQLPNQKSVLGLSYFNSASNAS